eukprot:g39236.t1
MFNLNVASLSNTDNNSMRHCIIVLTGIELLSVILVSLGLTTLNKQVGFTWRHVLRNVASHIVYNCTRDGKHLQKSADRTPEFRTLSGGCYDVNCLSRVG